MLGPAEKQIPLPLRGIGMTEKRWAQAEKPHAFQAAEFRNAGRHLRMLAQTKTAPLPAAW